MPEVDAAVVRHVEVPWRLFEDTETLRGVKSSESGGPLPEMAAEALEVHSRTDLVEALFKPVLQFLRKSGSQVVVVVFSAVNGNVHTKRNLIVQGSDLPESLVHAKKQLEAFLQSGGPYSDNEQDAVQAGAVQTATAVRVSSESPYQSPLHDSFVRKQVTFGDFAEITELIDKYWGQLLPRHSDTFLDGNKQQQSMRNSSEQPAAFRMWQTNEGAALLGKPISELRDLNIRLILLVDDPLLAWFITTRSRSQVLAFVKADHIYDVSYKSESDFAPCASPHTALVGKFYLTAKCSVRHWC